MSDSNWIGKQLGNYQLIKLLGAGGFAEVYLGEHIHLGTQAAIKVLHTQLGDEDVDHFRTEARTVARLIHPNIVRVLDFGVEGRTPYLVMDFAPKGTLRQQHMKGQLLPVATVISYVRQVADALQCAHDEKLIHRDVKPENMLVGRRNEILLSDFGIALVAQSSRYQSTKDMAGTMAYMAPEQIQGKPRPASDQYALGIVVYEWLTGERPFHGSFTEIVAQHIAVPPPPLRQKVPTLHEDIERVVMIALEKDYQKRFASIQGFANALEHVGKQIELTPIEPQTSVLEPTIVVPDVAKAKPSPLPPTVYIPEKKPFEAEKEMGQKGEVRPVGSIVSICQGHSNGIRAIAWSPDSTCIASGGDDYTVYIQSISSGQILLTYQRHRSTITAIAWSTVGDRIASGDVNRTVQIWDVASGRTMFTYRGHTSPLYAVTWSLDGKNVMSISKREPLLTWNASTGALLSSQERYASSLWHWVNAISWSPSASYLVSGDASGTARVLNAASGEVVVTYRGHAGPIHAVTYSSSGKYVASASGDRTVQVWNAATGKNIFTYRHNSPILAVAWSPDGKYIASGGDDKKVTVWIAP